MTLWILLQVYIPKIRPLCLVVFVTDIQNLKQNMFLGHMTQIAKIAILCTFKGARFQWLVLMIQVLWDLTPCVPVGTDILEKCSIFSMFEVKQS